MDDVKDKVKGFMKKVNNPFSSSSSGKFKGQGRVLGSSSSAPPNPAPPSRPSQTVDSKNRISPTAQSIPKPSSPPPPPQNFPTSDRRPGEFDPFDPFLSSGERIGNGCSINIFECPVCGGSYRSEEDVSLHVESCLSNSAKNTEIISDYPDDKLNVDSRNELAVRVSTFMSGEPSEGSLEIILRLLSNIVKEPGNAKFRRIRMSNPKIKEAIGAVPGGVELLESVGFRLQEEGEEIWAIMEVPLDDQIVLIKEAVSLMEPKKTGEMALVSQNTVESQVEPKKFDRQVRVFFSVPETVAARIDLPDSFYNLSAEELKREADLRKKKIAESQLLIPKSLKEKQAKAARRRYKATIIRIQFPDGVVLQGVFLPREPITALYEFVSSALKEPGLEFELLQPALPKRRVIPRFPGAGGRMPTLDDEDLVPTALVKFKPIETDAIVFTGLSNELLVAIEPLTTTTTVAAP